MYIGTFSLIESSEVCLLRVDLEENGGTARYVLTDSTGGMHTWTLDLTHDDTSEGFEDRARLSLAWYLADCRSRGWTGLVSVVQTGAGHSIPTYSWAGMLAVWNGNNSTTKPEGVQLQ